jgi:3-oxoacyl-[acyl-carrier protein] reductase
VQTNASGVIVTGAASGMGRACAVLLAERGWTVGLIDIAKDAVQELADGCAGRMIALGADVTDGTEVRAAVAEFTSRAGPLTACVNAAGVYPPSTFESADEALYRRIFDINVWGTMTVAQAAVAAFPEDRGGSVVNFASADAFVAKPQQILYAASKAAVVHLTRTMAAWLADRNVRVNAIAPGPVDTEGMRDTPRMREVRARVPLGRVAEVSEMASLAGWLLDDPASAFITGETIVASGGLVMRG